MIDQIAIDIRRTRVGASDIPCLFGLGFGRSSWDIWARITGRIRDEWQGNEMTEAGQYLEPAVLQWFEDHHARGMMSRDICMVSSDDRRVANLDGLVTFGPHAGPVEVKTSGLFYSGSANRWGSPDDGDWGVPPYVLLQVHQQIDIAREQYPGIRGASVVAFIGGRGFCVYRVPFSQPLADAIRRRVDRFWSENIEADVEPVDSMPSMETLTALKRVSGMSVPIDDSLVRELLDVRSRLSALEKQYRELKEQAIRSLGKAEVGVSPSGTVSYRGRFNLTPAKKPEGKGNE